MTYRASISVFDQDEGKWRDPQPVQDFSGIEESKDWLRSVAVLEEHIHPNDLYQGKTVRIMYKVELIDDSSNVSLCLVDLRIFDCSLSFTWREFK